MSQCIDQEIEIEPAYKYGYTLGILNFALSELSKPGNTKKVVLKRLKSAMESNEWLKSDMDSFFDGWSI